MRAARWGTSLSYGQVRGKNKINGDPLNDTPADHWMSQWDYYWRDLTVSTEFTYTEAQKVSEYRSHGRILAFQNLSLNYALPIWSVGLRVNNLYNRAYRPMPPLTQIQVGISEFLPPMYFRESSVVSPWEMVGFVEEKL